MGRDGCRRFLGGFVLPVSRRRDASCCVCIRIRSLIIPTGRGGISVMGCGRLPPGAFALALAEARAPHSLVLNPILSGWAAVLTIILSPSSSVASGLFTDLQFHTTLLAVMGRIGLGTIRKERSILFIGLLFPPLATSAGRGPLSSPRRSSPSSIVTLPPPYPPNFLQSAAVLLLLVAR